MTKAIVLGGSRGIGKAISDSLKTIDIDVFATSQKDIDTSNLNNVKEFLKNNSETDVLILNTGGPEPKPFSTITEDDWNKYHNQLFLGFCTILQNIKINGINTNVALQYVEKRSEDEIHFIPIVHSVGELRYLNAHKIVDLSTKNIAITKSISVDSNAIWLAELLNLTQYSY